MKKLENFFLSSEFIATVDYDEVQATFNAMVECGIDYAPFPEFYITVDENQAIVVTKDDKPIDPQPKMGLLEFHYSGLSDHISQIKDLDAVAINSWHGNRVLNYRKVIPDCDDKLNEFKDKFISSIRIHAEHILKILVVALATKNIVKDRKENKLAKLGIGKGRASKHSYITTISPPPIIEAEENHGTGKPKRPHLRRGHVRLQKYGPNRQFTHQIFIHPVFVNSDKEFVSLRDRYNVSLGG